MNMCRACLSTREIFTYVLFENITPDIYRFCTSIKISEDENLPRTICNDCYVQIEQFTNFKKTCLHSQKILLGLQQESVKLEQGESQVFDDSHKNSLKEEYSVKEDNGVKEERRYNGEPEGNYIEIGRTPDTSTSFKETEIEKSTRKAKKRKGKPRQLKHKKNPSKNYKLTCNICKKRFKHDEHFEAHKLSHEGKTATICCKICNKTYNRWCNLRRHHINTHTLVKMDSFKCPKCGKLMLNSDSLRMHMRGHRRQNKMIYICDICGKNMSSKPALERHLQTHNINRERKFACQLCDKKFFENQSLTQHIAKAHTEDKERYICLLCSTSFTCKKSLETHILVVHQGVRNYKCDLCGRDFSKLQTLKIHKRTHTGEKPYPCTMCSKWFISKSRLSDHVRTHTGERPHKCRVCNQAYIQRSSLTRHLKIHNKVPVLVYDQ